MRKLKILFMVLLTAAIVSGCNVTLRPITVRRPVYSYPVYQVCPPVYHHHYSYRYYPRR